METVNPSSQPNSGRIISHNLHLLNDSYDDQETGSGPSSNQDNSHLGQNGMVEKNHHSRSSAMEVNNNMGQYGEESPGGAQPNRDVGYPEQFRDSLEDGNDYNRPASNSSAGSRGMDDSPVENSKKSLSAEKQYQEDLRERVKQSFADLGLEPEGVLKDSPEEESKRQRKKRKPTNSERGSAPGSGGTDHGSQSEQDSQGHDTEPDYDANEPGEYANEADNRDREQGLQDETTPRGYPEDSGLRHDDDDTLGDSNPNRDYPDQGDYEDDKTPRAYPNQGAEESGPQEDYPGYENENNYNAANVDNEAPVRYPEVNEGYENNDTPPSHPEDYPNGGHYNNNPETDDPYSSYPDQGINAYGAQADEEENPDTGSYPNEGNYPEGKSYPEQDRYPEQGSYPDESGYPNEDDRAPKINEEDPENVPPPSYPSRYDNQEYAGDEDQYDDRNPSQDRPHENQSSGDEPRTGHYDQTPRDSLDTGHPTGARNDDDAPTDSLEYDYEPKDETYNPQDFHNSREPEPQDSLDIGYPKPAPEQSQPSDTYGNTYGDTYGGDDQAPYDSLDEEKSPTVPNQTAPREVIEPVDEPRRDSPVLQQAAVPSTQSDAVQIGGSYSNNSSAKSNRDPNGLSAGSGVTSYKQSPEPRSLPPSGKRRPSAGSRSPGQGSKESNPQGYSNRERRKSSASQKGSAGSERSKLNSHQQAGSSYQLGSQVSLSSGNPNRSRLQGNRAKASPIPADELSAKELLKRTRSKGPEGMTERPKIEHSDSQIVKKNGEDVRVSYISDDSGDEGEHFLDEKGSPVDQFGKPLYKDLHGSKKPEEPKFEFRIKPTPPKQKSPLDLQSVNARRTSADTGSAKKIPIGGKITIAKPFPVDEPTIEKAEGTRTGLMDGALPPRQDTIENITQKTDVQPEGINDSTLPPPWHDASTQKEVTESPANSASKSRTPFGDVTLRSVGTGMSARPHGRGGNRIESGTTKDDNYKDLRFGSEGAAAHGRENKASIEEAINKDLEAGEKKSYQPRTSTRDTSRHASSGVPLSGTYNKKDFEKKYEIPPASRGPSGASYTEKGIQYTPQEGQRREPEPSAFPQYPSNVPQEGYQTQQQYEVENQRQVHYPNDQNDFNQPGFPNAAQQYHQDGYQVQPNWEAQQQHGAPWTSGQPQQVHQPFYNKGPPPVQGGYNPQEGYYNQPGYDGPIGRPSIPQSDQGQYYGQQAPYPENYQSAPPHGRPVLPHSGYMSPSHSGGPPTNRFYPNQGIQPQAGYYPNQEQPVQNEPPPSKQRAPPKPKPNFIDMNKANLTRGPPRKRYSDMQKKVTPPIRANPKKPLPDISRENSLDDPWGEQSYNQGSAHTWSQENWTRQLVQQQQQLPLRRGHSDTNLYTQTQAQSYRPGPILQGYQTEGAPFPPNIPYNDAVDLGYSQDPRVNQPAYNQTFPPQMPRYQNGQVYSYSADHATHYARNNGHPQMSGPPRARVAFADDPRNSFDSDVNPMMFANEGGGVPYQHGMQRTSPYAVLPDIPAQHNNDGTSVLRKSDPDGYTARLMKQKQPPQYKQYTLKDYRNLKNDIKLGGLGPDAELVSEKQDKVNRQRDYAKTVMQQNKKQLQQTKRLWPDAPTVPREESPSKRDVALAYSQLVPRPTVRHDLLYDDDDWPKDSRTLAKEYSKNIPKPRLPTPPEVLHERMYGASSRQHQQQQYEEAAHEQRSTSEMLHLAELKARHEKEKEEVEKLRKDPSKT